MSERMAAGTPLPAVAAGQPEPIPVPQRDRDLLGRTDSPIRKALLKIRDEIREGFYNQSDRADSIDDYWKCYNCELSDLQFYNGNAAIYVPIIRDAVNACVTRFVNQLFPQSGRYVEATSSDGHVGADVVALLDHYIRASKFKTKVAKPLFRNAYMEGQFNVYVDWNEVRRQLVSRETHGPRDPLTGAEMPGPPIEDMREEDVIEGRPAFEVLHDTDVLVLPATANSIEGALAAGGHVTIVRRWSKAKIRAMKKVGNIRDDEADELLEIMGKVADDKDLGKVLNEMVGIRKAGKECVVWETWTELPLGEKGYKEKDGVPRLCRAFFGPADLILGCKRNPHWNDRCPLLSEPFEKEAGVFKGLPPVKPCASIQYEANDAVNEGADAAAYSAMPIVARDPEQGNGPMILNLGAFWEVPPGAIQFMTFPDLTPRAVIRVQAAAQQIFQTLGVNPAMLPQSTGRPGAKRNQAEIAMEQTVDLLTTAEVVSIAEEGIFSPACGWMVDLDYQFRDRPLTVRMFGEMGHQAQMQEVAPLQNRHGFSFTWRGGDQVRQNAMMKQDGMALINVLVAAQPLLQAEGLTLHIGPLVEAQSLNTFGPSLASKIITDDRHKMSLDPMMENQMMADGFVVSPQPTDEIGVHIPAHQQALLLTGDPHGTIKLHMQAHLQMEQMKAQAAQIAQGGGASAAGAPPAGPRGTPPGARPAPPRAMKGPPGMIHPDQMPRQGAVPMPRFKPM